MKKFLLLFVLFISCSSQPKFESKYAVKCDTVCMKNAIALFSKDSITGEYYVSGYADTFYIVETDDYGRIVSQTVVDHWPLTENP